jgi:two-component system, NarL family, sensor kinase
MKIICRFFGLWIRPIFGIAQTIHFKKLAKKMNLNRFVSMAILSFFTINCFSQVSENDSLQKVIESSIAEKEKLNAYKKLSNIFATKDFDKSQSYSTIGLAIATKNKDFFSQAYFKKQIGLAYYFKGKYDSAANYYYSALNILKTESKNLIEKDVEKAGILNELGKLYRKTKDLERSLLHYDEAYKLYLNATNFDGMATILNESGVVFEYQENYTEAINRYKKSLAIREKLNDLVGKSYSLNFIGGAYTLQKNFTEAENYLTQSLNVRLQLKDSFAIAINYGDLGFMFTQKGDYKKATSFYLLSNAIAEKIKYQDLKLSNYKELGTISEKEGAFAKALTYTQKYISLKDSIYSKNKMEQIEELNTKYQTEKKEQQLLLQETKIKTKNYLLFGLFGGTCLLAFAGFSFYRKRQTQNKLQLQTEVMKQQDLATKAVLEAEEKERQRIARDLHDGVGQVMSAAKMNLSAFENELIFKDENQKLSFEKVISLVDEGCKEVRNVSHQMMPNALLKAGLASAIREFIGKIESPSLKVNLYTEGLNERLDNNIETVLYRVIQECVNNVIKHAGANQLDISLIKDTDGISATVEDNGKGFSASNASNLEGIGLKNIKSRVEFLKGTVDFDSSEGNGTLVAIHVPVI